MGKAEVEAFEHYDLGLRFLSSFPIKDPYPLEGRVVVQVCRCSYRLYLLTSPSCC